MIGDDNSKNNFFHLFSKWPPQRSLKLWDDQWSEMLDCGLKQNPKCATSTDKKQNWIIFNRLSVIQNQHRRLVVGHPVFCTKISIPRNYYTIYCATRRYILPLEFEDSTCEIPYIINVWGNMWGNVGGRDPEIFEILGNWMLDTYALVIYL